MNPDLKPILKECGVTKAEVLSGSRKPHILAAREACMAYMLRMALSTKAVGRYFRCAHNTVSRANRRFNVYSEIYPLQRKLDREIIPQLLRS